MVDRGQQERAVHVFRQARRIRELEAALKPFANFIQKYDAQPMANMDDAIYRIHVGTEWEAEITRTDCRRASDLLKKVAKC